MPKSTLTTFGIGYAPNTWDSLVKAMKAAGAPTECEEVGVSKEFMADALRYHNYMRYRLHLPRLFPMMGIDPMDYID